jgi:hypothetical protein
MDNQIKTSFIPRKTIDAAVNFQTGPVKSGKVGKTIFSLIATFIFIGTLAMSGLVFGWQIKLKQDISKQVESMQNTRKSFDEKFIQEASRLDTRIVESGNMLHNHVSPSSLYSLLEEYTLQTVAFSEFTFKDNLDGTIGIMGSGEAKQYESIVLQSDAFGKSGYLRNVVFTDWRPDENNKNVQFSFEATLDPKLVLYRESLASSNEKPE